MSNAASTNAVGAGAGAAAAAAREARIKKMIGPVAFLEAADFESLLPLLTDAIVVESHQGFFSKSYHYITHAFGLTWYCKSKDRVSAPENVSLVKAEKIVVPE